MRRARKRSDLRLIFAKKALDFERPFLCEPELAVVQIGLAGPENGLGKTRLIWRVGPDLRLKGDAAKRSVGLANVPVFGGLHFSSVEHLKPGLI